MSKLSIYENSWLNLVFEGKNQEYGAYQLRRETTKTTATAFFAGLLFITAIACIPLIAGLFNAKPASISIPDIFDPVIHVSLIDPFQPKTPKQVLAVKKPVSDVKPKERLRNPEITKHEDAAKNLANNKDNTDVAVIETSGTGTISAINPTSENPETTSVEIPVKPNGSEVAIPATVDVMPEFPGGVKKFLDYVGNNFAKPEIEMTVSVVMSFVIEKDGTMTDIKVLRNPGYGLDKEAIRVLKSLKTKWKPGIKNGQPIRVLYTLPIKVQP